MLTSLANNIKIQASPSPFTFLNCRKTKHLHLQGKARNSPSPATFSDHLTIPCNFLQPPHHHLQLPLMRAKISSMEQSYSVNEVFVSDVVESGDGFTDVGFRVGSSSETDVHVVEGSDESSRKWIQLMHRDNHVAFDEFVDHGSAMNNMNIDEDNMDSSNVLG
ncbi:hypothetical protein L6452_08820 [Arctium lappa]|uniref:Uncharacterized protein n=1 Tax=Arctium lappa TaxID=4217 RepID=A0ACB9DIC5_ARCLA|nr:hypothetical protein L6452_08820 [Arctium lappa]